MKAILISSGVFAVACASTRALSGNWLTWCFFHPGQGHAGELRDADCGLPQAQRRAQGHSILFGGALADDFSSEVNDTSFHVSPHLVFATQKDYDVYQTHPRHLQFIQENKHVWSKVRVLDSWLTPSAYDRVPTGERGFSGIFRGRAVATRNGRFVFHVSEITNVWRHSDARQPD